MVGPFGGKRLLFIARLISGWVNIAFLVAVAIRWREGNGLAVKILRAATLLMIPFSCIVFYQEDLFPREGHVLWIASMVVERVVPPHTDDSEQNRPRVHTLVEVSCG